MKTENKFIVCSECFVDRGLRLDAEQIGQAEDILCPNCGAMNGKKLPLEGLGALAYRFFVWGSLHRCSYGAAPLIQFNEHQKTCINVSPWLKEDVALIEKLLGVGFFHYGPRLWMVGEVEPLKTLQNSKTRSAIIRRIINGYPQRFFDSDQSLYRIRKSPKEPSNPQEYDSPPKNLTGVGRLDTKGAPVLYGSPDLQLCVHECRVTAEDDLYVATLRPTRSLRLLDLSALLSEENVTEFESLDMAVHMLFLAGEHSYKISRSIAKSAQSAGFDGIIYPSYFSLLRIGQMPFQTVYGISNRRIPQYQEYEQSKSIPNLAIFGSLIKNGSIAVESINKLVLSRVEYSFHFGPVNF
jgi:hypothetical protein